MFGRRQLLYCIAARRKHVYYAVAAYGVVAITKCEKQQEQPKPNLSPSEVATHPEEDAVTMHGLQRYSGYAASLRLILVKGIIKVQRYVAYSSDVGEAFRPILSPQMITATYGIAWAYVLSDVALTGYKEHKAGAAPKDVAISVAHAAIFQSLASMIIPMYTIHTIVHQAEIAFLRWGRFVKWGPSAVGLAVFPLLPLIDPPVEHAVGWVFDRLFPDWKRSTHH